MFKTRITRLLALAVLAVAFGGAPDAGATLPPNRVVGSRTVDTMVRPVPAVQVPASQQASGFVSYENASECCVCAKSVGNATTPLVKAVTGVADEALVHFSPEPFAVVKPGAGGELFAFRYGDIKYLTPRQLETVIGPLSRGGQTGGARVMHVLESGVSGATRMPGAVVSEFPEYILTTPSRVTETLIVQ